MKKLIIALILTISMIQAEAQNYDESKVPSYTLPEILRTNTNTIVKTKKRGKRLEGLKS